MAIHGTRDIVESIEEGRTNIYSFRKAPTQISTAGIWFDLSSSPGLPGPKYWFGTPLVATPISGRDDNGMFQGAGVSPASKYVYRTNIMTNSAANFARKIVFMDYLMYYPLVDDGTTDPQEMDNTQTLPRYIDGEGVQIMAVSVAARTGGQSFTVTYTNQDGTSGRVTSAVVQNTSSAVGSIVTSETASAGNRPLFLPLQAGDTGVRSIESVTMLGADVGLFSLILVKPLFESGVQEQTAPTEINHLYEKQVLAKIEDDAFISAVCLPNGSLSGITMYFQFQTIWST